MGDGNRRVRELPPPQWTVRQPAQCPPTYGAGRSMCQRRLVAVLGGIPMCVLAAWCLLVWATTSHLYALLCLGVTWLIFLQGNRLIRREAPSSQAYDKAMQQCSDRRLPLWTLVATSIMCRKFLPPASHSIDWVPMAHFAIASGVLSLVIASRYIGPASIVRCSAVPLHINPFLHKIQTVYARCTSVESILDMMAGPDPRTKPHLSGHYKTIQPASRPPYRYPPVTTCFAQVCVYVIGGMTLAYSSVLPLLDHYWHNKEEDLVFMVTICVVCLLVILMGTVLDGKSHELMTPRNMPANVENDVVSFFQHTLVAQVARELRLRRNLLPWLLLTPLLSFSVEYMCQHAIFDDNPHKVESRSTQNAIGSIFISYAITIGISFYMLLMQVMVSHVLCMPGADIDKVIPSSYLYYLSSNKFGQNGKQEPLLLEDLIVSSILLGNKDIIRNVTAPKGHNGGGSSIRNDLEGEEVRRNDQCMEHVSCFLLSRSVAPKTGLFQNCAVYMSSLEDDLLRIVLLEALGGGGWENTNDISATRHMHAIRHRLEVSNQQSLASMARGHAPIVIPVVRALCAYAGGLGESLLNICNSHETSHEERMKQEPLQQQQLEFRSFSSEGWVIPAGAAVCSEYAIVAATRFVLLNLSSSSLNMRHSHLSLLIPTVLHSAHRLHQGISCFAQMCRTRDGFDAVTNKSFLALQYPELCPTLLASEEAALFILRGLDPSINATNGSHIKSVCAEIRVHNDCRAWLVELLERG